MSTADRCLHPQLLETYRRENSDLLREDPEFDRWLRESYVPIAGAWQY